jgi:hypothetical protein
LLVVWIGYAGETGRHQHGVNRCSARRPSDARTPW